MSSASTGGTEGSSPASSTASAASLAMAAPKFGTLVPNRIFVGGISASTSEAELTQLFSAYGNVKATKIISDRAGVSKGYGFVTFETDEEARRLQRESECIILRERKLNIAPAIKKQPFNRPFDGGSGSPPAVPTSTYYYTNGMGLAYQNGLTFYNAGAPAPGTPIAPPTDSTTIYQTAGVFGPQATSGHQTFAPVVYSCPTPSLYMPQQYQYSPMTYESYYTGAAAGGGPPQYALYATSPGTNQHEQQQQQQQQQTPQGPSNGCVGGGGVGVGGASSAVGAVGNGTNASSPPNLASLPPPPGHFYAPSAPQPQSHHHHHHPPVPSGPLPPQPQLDHLYYSFAAPGPPPVPPQPQHQTIGIGDQQLLLYTTDPTSCQQLTTTTDSQATAQEDARSTSSHSEQPQHSDGQQHQHLQPQLSAPAPLMSLMPLKYPLMPARYGNYHPMALHQPGIQQSHQSLTQAKSQNNLNGSNGSGRESTNSMSESTELDELANNSHQSATTFIYPATVYIPHHGTAYQPSACQTIGPSLLPTPSNIYENQQKLHQSYPTKRSVNNSYGITLGYHRTQAGYSSLGGLGGLGGLEQQSNYQKNSAYSRKYPTDHLHVNSSMEKNRYYYGKNGSTSQYSYVTPRTTGIFGQINPSSVNMSSNLSTMSIGYNGQACVNSRRNTNDHHSLDLCDKTTGRYENSRRRDNSVHSRIGKNSFSDNHANDGTSGISDVEIIDDSRRKCDKNNVTSGIIVTDRNNPSPSVINNINNNNNNNSPPPAPYSPMTRPIPNISPPISQVQFYSSGPQSRYHQQISHHQQSNQRRYGTLGQSITTGRKIPGSNSGQNSGDHLRRPKNKIINGIGQSASVNCKLQDDHCLGGGGDATGSNVINRMPITPPPTPRNHGTGSNNSASLNNPGTDNNTISDACHQMQTLTM